MRARVVMLNTFDLDEYVYAALLAGASGFLLKETRPEVLADAVRTVAGGEALLAPSVLRRLVDRHAQAVPLDTGRLAALTDREIDVLRLIGRGYSNSELSAALWLAETTVRTHITRIFCKLELRDRAQAVVLAYETGLITAGDPGWSRLVMEDPVVSRDRPIGGVGSTSASRHVRTPLRVRCKQTA